MYMLILTSMDEGSQRLRGGCSPKFLDFFHVCGHLFLYVHTFSREGIKASPIFLKALPLF